MKNIMNQNYGIAKALLTTVTVGLTLGLTACTTAPGLKETHKTDQLPSAGKEQTRITDGVIRTDRQYLKSLQMRLASLNEKGIPSTSYFLTKATAWVDFALEEYTDNDRSGIVERIVLQATSLIQKLERGDVAIDRSTVIIEGSQRIRSDLWAKVEAYHSNKNFNCIANRLGVAEVQLVWAGHESLDGGWRHAKPYIEIAEDLFKTMDLELSKCESSSVASASLKPDLRPEAKPALVQPLPLLSPSPSPLPPPILAVAPNVIDAAPIRMATDTLFTFNKATLTDVLPQGKFLLDEFVALLRQFKSIDRILITGHTDRLGESTYNLQLSEARAKAIEQYLVLRGVTARVIQSAGAGEIEPIVTCTGNKDSPDLRKCLQSNRRVEVRVSGSR
jgi:OmpA-OmpF porin, OOP family